MIRPTNSVPSGGEDLVWGEKSRGLEKVNKSMAKLGMNIQTGVMQREYGPNLTPLQKAWKPAPRST